MRFQPSLQIRQQLLRYIIEGQFEPNKPLPTIEALAATFKVSTKTVQKAVHALSAEGIIEAKRGIGLFVKSITPQCTRGSRVGLVFCQYPRYLESHPWPGAVVEALRNELRQGGYTLVPCPILELNRLDIAETLRKQKLCAAVMLEVDSDALIFEFREIRVPFVCMDYDAYRHGVGSVVFDNTFGTFQATKALIKLGHRSIAFMRPLLRKPIANNRSLDVVEDERVKGYRLAMQDAELNPLVIEYVNRVPVVERHLEELLSRRPATTGIVCAADWVAHGIAERVREMGVRIPEDLSIIGFGNLGKEFAPGRVMGSVAIDYAEMGRAAGVFLLKAMEGQAAAERIVLPAHVVMHDSMAAVNPAEISRLPALAKAAGN